mgnify:CR=1 FL=1
MVDINKIIEQAIKKDASDIHLMAESKPMYRIGNSLVKMEGAIALKNEDMSDIYKNFTKGNMVYEFNGINVDVNLSYSNQTPVYTMKILKNKLPEYEELGLPEILRKMTNQEQGLILVVGNRKSGKTTTLNALVRNINETQNKKIITLEKLIEYTHISRNSIIVQKQVGTDFENYAQGVKNALKEDCDVLVVEDIRNRETMEAVLEFVEEGHLVIAGINANSCSGAIEKLENLYNSNDQAQIKYALSTLLKLIISQKLILGTKGNLELITEVNAPGVPKQNISYIKSLAKLYVENKITLKQAKVQIDEKDADILNNTIMKMRIKK